MARTTVWIVVYTHRHGTDLYVCATENGAIRKAATIADENAGEFGLGDDYSWGDWFQLTDGDENIEITPSEVLP